MTTKRVLLKNSGISMREISQMDVFSFFVLLTDIEDAEEKK